MTAGDLVGRFFVPGHPRTKGSMTPQLSRGKGGALRVHLVESGTYSKSWKVKMIREIHAMMMREKIMEPYAGVVAVAATFVYERPAVGVSLALPYPTLAAGENAQGDLDKLLRNLLDALTQSGLIKDDSLVAKIGSEKRWAHPTMNPLAGVACEVVAL